MKIALLSYHSNVTNIYPQKWIDEYKQSILKQTYKKFDIFEIEYSGSEYRIFENSNYERKELASFVDAMNYLIDKCFNLGYDYVLNSNVDDFYSLNRVEKQLNAMKKGWDVISCNFELIKEGVTFYTHFFEKKDIGVELSRGHNIICHPAVVISAKFWQQNRYVPNEVPREDLLLWQRAINNGSTFIILEDVLCYHRLHSNSVCNSGNR